MVVYILYSATIDAFYVGQTELLSSRLDQHLNHLFAQSFTKRATDWTVFLTIDCVSRVQAVNIENHIKKMKSRVYLQNLKRYPELVLKLKDRYQ
ncbi:MAG TPA: GIY-YIG nuclease family protein [Chryseosolibacter sp.]